MTIHRRIATGALVLLALALGTAPAAGQSRSLGVEDFHASLTVTRSGALHVQERIRFRFEGSWNGVYRSIPVSYRNPAGFDYRLRVSVESATLADGTPLRVEEEREGRNLVLRVWVPGAQDATRTVLLNYRVPNALRFFDTHDELYWNVTGTEWDVPLGPASAEVLLPEGFTGLRSTAYTGPFGSQAQEASITSTAGGIQVRSSGALGFREGLTLVVGWDPGVVERPSGAERVGGFLLANGLLLLPLVSLVWMWRHWQERGRDPELGSVSPEYRPPQGLTPGETGTLVDNRPDMRDITATLVDLAIRGFLRIEEEEAGPLERFLGKKRFEFVLLRPREEWDALLPHEDRVLSGVFKAGAARVGTDELENEFYKEIPGIRDTLFEALVSHGFYVRRPDKVVERYVGIGIAVGVLLTVGLLFLTGSLNLSPVTAVVAGVGTTIPVLVFGAFMGSRTRKGVEKLREILGFQEFLGRVESDRFRRMIQGPEQFEAFLPHAMALGVERQWAEAFDGIYTEPPDWYRGRYPGPFRPTYLAANMGELNRHAGAAMASAPRSSSGSSGFSGGSSGGGFGGGGGGGF
ncbi:MAG TPA: DUF2207 domain-containing protein [Longimicrobiales bacterium]|nr:DUF2207 domain-containing protein [Longimicrobiales bacterium]